MDKINYALTHLELILNGLTRGIDLSVLDKGYGEHGGSPVCFFPTTHALGLVMPSNSPAVNSLWLPSIALKIPIIMKPGREEPWDSYRLIQAFIAAGCPKEAFGFYPTDHEGAGDILKHCGRALIFGDKSTTDLYAGDPGVQVHGPGFSKILIGDDEIENWRDYLDIMVSSISDNAGRSCVNASAVIVPKYAKEIADALGQRLGLLKPLPAADPDAVLSGFANPKMGDGIDQTLESDFAEKGAIDSTAPYRDGPRLVQTEGGHICVQLSHTVNLWITLFRIGNFCVLTQVLFKSTKTECYRQLDRLWWLPRLQIMRTLKISCWQPAMSND